MIRRRSPGSRRALSVTATISRPRSAPSLSRAKLTRPASIARRDRARRPWTFRSWSRKAGSDHRPGRRTRLAPPPREGSARPSGPTWPTRWRPTIRRRSPGSRGALSVTATTSRPRSAPSLSRAKLTRPASVARRDRARRPWTFRSWSRKAGSDHRPGRRTRLAPPPREGTARPSGPPGQRDGDR
jgi:hypothetical protein